MLSLKPPDTFHLSAAQGWLELGNHMAANEELEQITPALRTHPEVLKLRCQIFGKAGRWEACVAIEQALVKTEPDMPERWIHRS